MRIPQRVTVLHAWRKLTYKNWIFPANWKPLSEQGLGASDMLNICVIKIINNLLHAYDNFTGKYKFLLNIFNKVTSQVKDYLK